jgi:hypothetical protein
MKVKKFFVAYGEIKDKKKESQENFPEILWPSGPEFLPGSLRERIWSVHR